MRISTPVSRLRNAVVGAGATGAPFARDAIPQSGTIFAQYVAKVVLFVFAGYYIGARVGLELTFLPNPISVLWPPNAILLSALLLVPPKRWWIAIIGALPAHLLAELQNGIPTSMVLCWFVSNVTEAVIGAAGIHLMATKPFAFNTPRNVVVFIFAAVFAIVLSSFLDTAFVKLNQWGQGGYWEVWATRLVSNVTSALIIVPAIVTWASGGIASLRLADQTRMMEAALLAAALVTVTLLVFDSDIATSAPRGLIYLPFPLLLWAALRFGPTGASASFAIVAFLTIWGAGHATGLFGTQSPVENARSVQLFLIFIAPTLLCLAVAVDERRRGEESLRLSDKRFQLVLEATQDAVYDRDLENGYLWWSRSGLKQFGYDKEEWSPDFSSWVDLVHPDDRERESKRLAAAIESGAQLWESEFRLRRSDGSYAHVHEQGFIVRDLAGKAQQLIGALTDITVRHDTEELGHRLAHASRLTAMGELTASIAHEISQPMSAILHNVDAAEILLDSGNERSHELREILLDIRSDNLRASEIIKHIRALVNKRESHFEPFDVRDVIADVLRLVSPIARRRNIGLLPVSRASSLVLGDRIHIQQVVLNLIFNAMDAVASLPKERRLIHIESRNLGSEEVAISVRDLGLGIPPQRMDKIFDSFFTTKHDGMGLGLSIARSLVQAHGGQISVTNNDDHGATFRVILPTVAKDGLAPDEKGAPT